MLFIIEVTDQNIMAIIGLMIMCAILCSVVFGITYFVFSRYVFKEKAAEPVVDTTVNNYCEDLDNTIRQMFKTVEF